MTDVLSHALTVLRRQGWVRGTRCDAEGQVCLLGALERADLELTREVSATAPRHPTYRQVLDRVHVRAAMRQLADVCREQYPETTQPRWPRDEERVSATIVQVNNELCRDQVDAEALLEKAILRSEEL